VRRAADALGDAGHDVVESRPPGQAEVRAAFDIVLVHEAATGMVPGLDGREQELSPPIREMLEALRGFEPAMAHYIDAFARLLALEHEADAWLERHGAALCPVAPDVAPAPRSGFRPSRCRSRARTGAFPSASSSSAAAATSGRCWRWRASSRTRSAAGWIPTGCRPCSGT
jgi:hypothetical protein